jgi:Tfp pilus assembly protein PilF
MLAMVPPTHTSEQFEPFIYAKACQDLLDTRQVEAGVTALQSAIKQWPDYWLSYFLLANHYLHEQPEVAVQWFKQGYQYGKQEAAYLNNYAYGLAQLGCYAQAKLIVDEGLLLAPNDENLLDNQQKIQQRRQKISQQIHQKKTTQQCQS